MLFASQVGARLRHLAEEEIDELNEQDEDYDDLQEEAARLIEMLDHVVAEVFGGLEFLGHEVFVNGHADLGGCGPVRPRGKHVTEKLDGIVGTLGELGHAGALFAVCAGNGGGAQGAHPRSKGKYTTGCAALPARVGRWFDGIELCCVTGSEW